MGLEVGVGGVSVKRQGREKMKMATPQHKTQGRGTRAVHCARCHKEPISECTHTSVLPFLCLVKHMTGQSTKIKLSHH